MDEAQSGSRRAPDKYVHRRSLERWPRVNLPSCCPSSPLRRAAERAPLSSVRPQFCSPPTFAARQTRGQEAKAAIAAEAARLLQPGQGGGARRGTTVVEVARRVPDGDMVITDAAPGHFAVEAMRARGVEVRCVR